MYKSGLPQAPEDGGNVTYLISNTDPPRDAALTTRLPPAIELRKRPELLLTPEQRRVNAGGLVFTLSQSIASNVGSAKKQFEIGQVLEFVGDEIIQIIEPMRVGKVTEIRHDTNVLDLSSLGLTDAEIDQIEKQSARRLKSLQTTLNGYRQEREDLEVDINENKKTQNETKKALEAISQLAKEDDSLQDAVIRLEQKQEELVKAEASLVVSANTAAANATSILDEIRGLAQVVR